VAKRPKSKRTTIPASKARDKKARTPTRTSHTAHSARPTSPTLLAGGKNKPKSKKHQPGHVAKLPVMVDLPVKAEQVPPPISPPPMSPPPQARSESSTSPDQMLRDTLVDPQLMDEVRNVLPAPDLDGTHRANGAGAAGCRAAICGERDVR
jgi:hypothetical protein